VIPDLVYTIAKSFDLEEILIWEANMLTMIPIATYSIREYFNLSQCTKLWDKDVFEERAKTHPIRFSDKL
jgi:hypothetical protein